MDQTFECAINQKYIYYRQMSILSSHSLIEIFQIHLEQICKKDKQNNF